MLQTKTNQTKPNQMRVRRFVKYSYGFPKTKKRDYHIRPNTAHIQDFRSYLFMGLALVSCDTGQGLLGFLLSTSLYAEAKWIGEARAFRRWVRTASAAVSPPLRFVSLQSIKSSRLVSSRLLGAVFISLFAVFLPTIFFCCISRLQWCAWSDD